MRYWKSKPMQKQYKVGIGVAAYFPEENRLRSALRCLVASFLAQTYEHWRMLIVHDGPYPHDPATLRFVDELTTDSRVYVIETPERKQQFGHPYRQLAIDNLTTDCHWITLTNQDNYYAPVFLEWLLHAGVSTPGCGFVHCDMVHSHRNWAYMTTQPRYKHLDLGSFMVNSVVAKDVPFNKFEFNGDGDWIDRLVEKAENRVQHVHATLFVHN